MATDDRSLILSGVEKLVAKEGYEALTVPRIRATAGVPRKAFEQHFDDVDDCFLTALEIRTRGVLAQAAPALASADSWAEGIYGAIGAICWQIARDRALGKLAFADVFAPGPPAVRRRALVIGDVAALFRESALHGEKPDELTAEACVGAVWGVIHHRVASGRSQQLPEIAATLTFLALAPVVGSQGTVEAIRRAQRSG